MSKITLFSIISLVLAFWQLSASGQVPGQIVMTAQGPMVFTGRGWMPYVQPQPVPPGPQMPGPSGLQLKWVGIPSVKVNISADHQKKDEWCWAATIEMALGCYGIKVPQDVIVARTKGVGWDGQPVDATGDDQDITRNLTGEGLDFAQKHYTVGCVQGQGVPSVPDLIAALQAKHPIVLALRNDGGGGHAVLLSAAGYYDLPGGPQVTELVVRDPWPYPDFETTHGRRVMPAPYFVSHVMSFWVVSATVDDQASADQKATELRDDLAKGDAAKDGYSQQNVAPDNQPAAAPADSDDSPAADALTDVELVSHDNQYDSDSELLTFKLGYKNNGDKPIRLRVKVKAMPASGFVALPGNNQALKTQSYAFTIQPGDTHEISDSWHIAKSDNGDPELHYGGSDDADDKSLLKAAYSQ